ncbi:unnamed protein product, partial [Polarella glacialis]
GAARCRRSVRPEIEVLACCSLARSVSSSAVLHSGHGAPAPEMSLHPHVDMRSVLLAGHPGRQAALAQIRTALTTRGYFYASNVESLPLDYINSVYRYSQLLHGLPVSTKRSFTRPRGSYTGTDAGVDEPAYEAGSVATVRAWDYSRTSGFSSYGTAFPEVVSECTGLGFAAFLDDLYARQDLLARALMLVFAEIFELPPDTFESRFDGEGGDMGTIRLLHYPAAADAEERDQRAAANYGISPHTDFEAFTLMHQSAPGLQFLPRSGGPWIDAPVRPQEFVVIVGDVLERFTNGFLRATPHRVLQTAWERNSIIRFNAVTPETLVEPLPQFVSDSRPARYTPVTMQKHMDTTLQLIEQGQGAWEPGDPGRSLSATRQYDSPADSL